MTLHIPHLSSAEAGYFTRLSRHHGHGTFRFLGAEWSVQLFPAAGDAPPPDTVDPVYLTVDLGGARLTLSIDGAIYREALRTVDPGGEPAAMPAPLRLALGELALSELTSALQDTFGHAVELIASDEHPPERLGRHRIDLHLHRTGSDRSLHGSLFLDARGLSVIAELASRLPQAEASPEDAWRNLPLPMRLDVGWTDMPLSDLRGLAVRDVVLLDQTTLLDDNRLTLRADGLTALKARLDGSTLIIEDIVRSTMTEDPAAPEIAPETPAKDPAAEAGEAPEAAPAEPMLDTLDAISVRLTFDIGQQTLTLGDLRTLTPGATFDLGRTPHQAVNIRANGALIGTGELISIDDRVGVRVATLPGTPE